jgi:hypothetical protein
LECAEREKDFELADRIKQISPVSWKHVNFYGEYRFRDIGDVVDLEQLINRFLPGLADLPIRRLAHITPAAWIAEHS